uniref:Uncharacterized protein n=1 Tax=Chenopodium quinoa TaxID=63459 RepID=A0A803MZD5_CHEQI
MDVTVNFDGQENRVSSAEVPISSSSMNLLQLSIDDVSDEIAYWNMSIVAFVIGETHILPLLLGFVIVFGVWRPKVVQANGHGDKAEQLVEKGPPADGVDQGFITLRKRPGVRNQSLSTPVLLNLMKLQKDIQSNIDDDSLRNKEFEMLEDFSQIRNQYFSWLSQKAKTNWLQVGDENNNFHRSIKMRKYRKRVIAVKNTSGVWCDNPRTVSEAFIEYYKGLLGDDPGEESVCVVRAKAPGPDGYNSTFFNSSWNIVGDQVADAVLQFFETDVRNKVPWCSELGRGFSVLTTLAGTGSNCGGLRIN